METQSLIAVLRSCKSALQPSGIYSVFGHFCFTEGKVYAFDDVVATVAPIDLDLECAINGDVLLGVLDTVGASVQIKRDGEGVLLSSGKARIKLAALSKENFLFKYPSVNASHKLEATDALMHGLEMCLETVGDDAHAPELTGVTLKVASGALHLYSSDDVRISRSRIKLRKGEETSERQWLLPARGCQVMIEAWRAMRDDESKPSLQLGEQWIRLTSANLAAYSKTLPHKPLDFDGLIKKIVPASATWSPIPDPLRAAIKRAEVLTAKDPFAGVQLSADGTALNVHLSSKDSGAHAGQFEEKMQLPGANAKQELTLGIVKLSSSLNDMTKLALSPRCLALQDEDGNHHRFVAPLSE